MEPQKHKSTKEPPGIHDGMYGLPTSRAGGTGRQAEAVREAIVSQENGSRLTSRLEMAVKIVLYPFVVLSALGLLLSLAAHIGALLGLDIPSEAMGLHMGIFVVWIPTVITANFSLIKGASRKDFWKVVLRGAPKWMRYMTYGFFTYGFINFFLFIMLARNGGDGQPSAIRAFSGHWMIFYSTAFTVLYSAIQIKNKGLVRRCPNGHEVPLDAAFCEQCGQVVSTTPRHDVT